MALSRSGLNVKDGVGNAAHTADNPGLDAIDVWIDVADAKTTLLACWAGPLPTVVGAGLFFRVPKVRGAAATFNLAELFSRLDSLPTASGVQFRVEKSAGGAAFTPTSIGSNTHGVSDYEKTSSPLTGTIATGDLVRIYFVNVTGGTGGAYEVELSALQQ